MVGKGGAGGGITTLIIAHRLSTIRNADRIVVLGSGDGGTSTANGSTIVEIGSHDQLMAKENGLYKALVGGHAIEDSNDNVTSAEESEVVASSTFGNSGNHDSDVIKSRVKSIDNAVDEDDNTESTGSDEDNLKLSSKEKSKLLEQDFKNIDKNRLRAYSKPETGHFIAGVFACFCTGLAFPTCGILFSLMITSMSLSDFDVVTKWTSWLAGASSSIRFL